MCNARSVSSLCHRDTKFYLEAGGDVPCGLGLEGKGSHKMYPEQEQTRKLGTVEVKRTESGC